MNQQSKQASKVSHGNISREPQAITTDQQSLVVQQFGSTAENYLSSTVHAQGQDLQRLAALAARLQPAHSLDLGCGAGHASFALASATSGAVTAYDLSGQMLQVVAAEAQRRDLRNLHTRQGLVENLPFGDASFDLVATRFSAHHWLDMERAAAEMVRVLKPGGTLVVIDVVAPEVPLFDTVLQTLELLRDSSHVRNYRVSEWKSMLVNAGLSFVGSDSWKLPLDFDSWVKRIRTSAARIAALQVSMQELPQEVKEYFAVQPDLSFSSDTAWIEARHH
ncbi:class I SAM-dependent methyltransferase [Undibacterium terreum]|uniref:S-adenosyl-L-methionine (SAM)-dependent methyltransferase PhcB n=1 Tax=Undibacterium terreum TaxID=1224302 RepID=A0A916XFN6_9BURK|nr:class I SAM-dependent methyltransferase [Undibacterium terreum]GGC68691.1 S-adenosyl-L-methionine (SAM)-dependent methyltransferase PhcB [Undibacterium terreum]